ncbi:DUF2155 domain-containing protein [Hyphomicrobium sp.]|uniref:DUF2155 domain-containing protein n=1 Tax=Hyphomicrobium sp. TaxID=82 RepID=UPI002D773BC7|nr:DUF2155 domain-containing protein [Hyphomicrobium sp.]HET6389410.1 DUF2155 domain-containing protein [Hyphomicrobium sp.]
MAPRPLSLVLAVTAMGAAAAPAYADRIENQVAVFSALDKVTAHIQKFEVEIGKTSTFGALKITPRVCNSRPPTEEPKTTTFVEIDETQLDGSEKRIFTGWMFAESPGIYGLEHPTYDVWLTECGKPIRTIAEQPAPGTAVALPAGGASEAPPDDAYRPATDGGYQDNGDAAYEQEFRRRVRR